MAANNVASYNPSFKQFTMNTSDRTLLVQTPFTYKVSSELAQWPGYGVLECTAQIVVTDPCLTGVSINLGMH